MALSHLDPTLQPQKQPPPQASHVLYLIMAVVLLGVSGLLAPPNANGDMPYTPPSLYLGISVLLAPPNANGNMPYTPPSLYLGVSALLAPPNANGDSTPAIAPITPGPCPTLTSLAPTALFILTYP